MLSFWLDKKGLHHLDILGVCGPHHLLLSEHTCTLVSRRIQCYPALSGLLFLFKEMGEIMLTVFQDTMTTMRGAHAGKIPLACRPD